MWHGGDLETRIHMSPQSPVIIIPSSSGAFEGGDVRYYPTKNCLIIGFHMGSRYLPYIIKTLRLISEL